MEDYFGLENDIPQQTWQKVKAKARVQLVGIVEGGGGAPIPRHTVSWTMDPHAAFKSEIPVLTDEQE